LSSSTHGRLIVWKSDAARKAVAAKPTTIQVLASFPRIAWPNERLFFAIARDGDDNPRVGITRQTFLPCGGLSFLASLAPG